MKQILQTNFVDDILSDSMGGKRRFNLIPNDDGTYSLEDVTEYDQLGSQFGSANINATNNAVNESADKNKILETLAEINAVTEAGYMADALAVKELNNSLNGVLIVQVVPFTANFDSTFHVAEGYVEIPYSGYTPLTANVRHAGSSDIYPYSLYVLGNALHYGLKSTSLTGEVNASAMVVYLKSEFLSN